MSSATFSKKGLNNIANGAFKLKTLILSDRESLSFSTIEIDLNLASVHNEEELNNIYDDPLHFFFYFLQNVLFFLLFVIFI